MDIFCVSYDLLRPGKDYLALIREIESTAGGWAKPLKSLYLVRTSETATELYSRLRSKMDANDLILIIHVRRPFFGFLDRDVIAWIDNNVPAL
jgi:hypothetical protein